MQLNLNEVSPLPGEVIRFLNDLASNRNIARLLIFGSRACGDYERYSDVDIAIEAKDISRREWLLIREIAYYDVRTVLQLSVVNFLKNPKIIREQIERNGRVIYEQ